MEVELFETFRAYLEHHPGLAVGETGHHQAGAVAERHVVGELEGLEVLGLARGLRHAHFLHREENLES